MIIEKDYRENPKIVEVESKKMFAVNAIDSLKKSSKEERINSKTQGIFNKAYDFLKNYGPDISDIKDKDLCRGVFICTGFKEDMGDYEVELVAISEVSIEKSFLDKENCKIKVTVYDPKLEKKLKKRLLFPLWTAVISLEPTKISIRRPDDQRVANVNYEDVDEVDLLNIEKIIDGLIISREAKKEKAKGAGDAGGAGPRPSSI